MKICYRIIDKMDKYLLYKPTMFLARIASVCVVLLVVVEGFEVIARKFLGFSTRCSEELSGFILVAVAFLGLSYTFIKGGHVVANTLYVLCSSRWRKVLDVLNGVAGIGFCSALAFYSWKLVIQDIQFHTSSSSWLKVPMVIPGIMIPIGCALTALLMLSHTVRVIFFPEIHGGKHYETEETHVAKS